MNGSGGRIYSVFAGTDRNLLQPATVYGHRFIASDSYHFATRFLPNTAHFLAVFTGNMGILLPGNIDLGTANHSYNIQHPKLIFTLFGSADIALLMYIE